MKIVTSFGCVLFLLAAVLADDKEEKIMEELREFIQNEAGECFENTNFSKDDMEKLHDVKEEDLEKPEVKELMTKFGCFMACIHKKLGTMENSQLIVEKLNEKIDEDLNEDVEKRDMVKKISTSCAEEVQDLQDECAVAAAYTVCTMKKMAE